MPAQAFASPAITGNWITAEKSAVIKVGQCVQGGQTICGRISRFVKAPAHGNDQRDDNNPDPKLRNRKLLGLSILTGFTRDGEVWRGKIYDPNTGNTYRSVVRRKSADVLEVKGCIGPFCQTQIWQKAR